MRPAPGPRLSFEQLEDRVTPASASLERVNVVLADPTPSARDAASLAAPFAASVEHVGFGIYRVELSLGKSAAKAAAYYSRLPGVVAASADTRVRVEQLPDDSSLDSLDGMARIDAPEAWDTTTGSRDFAVAVIDTGIDLTHPDLAANIWTNPGEVPGNGIDDDRNGYTDDVRGWDFANADNDPSDDNGHGTHVAGIVGAVGGDGEGVAGVNWAVSLVPLKFIDSAGRGWTSDAIAALDYAVRMGVRVSNASWGGGPIDATLATAVGRARLAGHVIVTAAGNDGENLDGAEFYPASFAASYNNVVAVASTDSHDRLAASSNYGPHSVTLAAPGVSILSTTLGGTYGRMSGTSMAAPHVAGAVALLWSRHPEWNYIQVIEQLKSSVDRLPELAGKVQTGGRLNVARMFAGSPPPAESAPGPVVVSSAFAGPAAGSLNRVRIVFDRPVNPGTFTSADVVGLSGPSGLIPVGFRVTPVAGSGSRLFDVTFAAQTVPGAYSLVIGPDVRDAGGNPMNQDGDATANEEADRFTAGGSLIVVVSRTASASELPQPIADRGTTTSAVAVAEPIRVSDLNVSVSLAHTYTGDLVIRLISPNGAAVTLFERRGANGNNLKNTVFDDEAAIPIGSTEARAPFKGSFRPEESLAAFDGTLAAGTWRLEVTDGADRDAGVLKGWSLTLTGTLGDGARRITPLAFGG